METVKLARNAMATRFEIVVHGSNAVSLRAAAEEALDEIERLDAKLSLYKPSSEIAQINANAAEQGVRVSAEIFGLLERARDLSLATGGAFDITIAPLVRCWGFMRGSGEMPEAEQIAEARQMVGIDLVQLDKSTHEVRFAKPGVMIDLGAVGKGYALDRAAEILAESGVEHALLHGGTSSVISLGQNGIDGNWKIAVDAPPAENGQAERPPVVLADLRNESLSVSGIWGKCFESGGKRLGHVLDARTGYPVAENLLAAVILPSGLESDALSTAMLVGGEEMFVALRELRPDARLLLVKMLGDSKEQIVRQYGFNA